MYSLSKIKHYYRARLRNELPISGLDSTDVYIYKGALLPVELSRRHPQIVVCSFFFEDVTMLPLLPISKDK